MSDSAIGITAIVGMAGWWRLRNLDRTVIYPAIAKWFLVRTAGIKADRAAREAAMGKRVELVGGVQNG